VAFEDTPSWLNYIHYIGLYVKQKCIELEEKPEEARRQRKHHLTLKKNLTPMDAEDRHEWRRTRVA